MIPEVDDYIRANDNWHEVLQTLRRLVLECGLREEYKWRAPCYTLEGKNIVLIGATQGHCVLSFMKGGLICDPEGILEKPGENSRIARLIRFETASQIVQMQAKLKSFIKHAIEIEESGAKLDLAQDPELEYPLELQNRLDADATFRSAFQRLTPGRRRGYAIYFSAAKRASTREARIDKYAARILEGKGLHDCVCGHSQRLPACDGSHNAFGKS